MHHSNNHYTAMELSRASYQMISSSHTSSWTGCMVYILKSKSCDAEDDLKMGFQAGRSPGCTNFPTFWDWLYYLWNFSYQWWMKFHTKSKSLKHSFLIFCFLIFHSSFISLLLSGFIESQSSTFKCNLNLHQYHLQQIQKRLTKQSRFFNQ
jgi:hypothetical protein